MNYYQVRIPVQGAVSIALFAKNEDDAIDLAIKQVEDQYIGAEFGSLFVNEIYGEECPSSYEIDPPRKDAEGGAKEATDGSSG